MQWEFLVALIVAIPVILFPAAFVWYMNAGGLYTAIKRAMARQPARKATIRRQATEPNK